MDVATVNSKATHGGYVPLRWVAVLFVFLAAFVYLTGLTASPDDAGIAYQTTAAIAIISVFAGVIVFCVLIHRRYVGTPLLGWPGWRRFLLEATIACPVAIVLVLLMSLPVFAKHFSDGGDIIYRPVIIAPVIYCLVGFTLAPVAEEMLYRAVLYGTLRRWMKPVFAAVLQALVFGVMHRYGLLYMSIAFASGLLFMAMYLWRQTLWSPILVHALNNALSVISLLVMLLAPSSHTFLGISMADAGAQPGERVTAIIPGTPAEEAKLNVGDVITAIDSLPIHQANDVRRIVGAHKPGDTIHLTLVRGRQSVEVAVELRAMRPHVLW
ncbi:MAG: CPBP family glutamic-type intramembrane protease [Tepidisphaeraceae bacterium]|jgi:membrane protease YdiL (CAAX protease family)